MAERDAQGPFVVERDAAEFPRVLLALSDPPRGLEVRGRLPLGRAVAIVGTRAATNYGRAIATRLARELASLGITVVSGLARGIDAAAHEGALEAGGWTVAVLPFGLEPVLPRMHEALAGSIAERGAVIAEWPRPGEFYKSLFLHRNRIIAGMTQATVVVEAGERSGALSTARVALALGRPCLAVPGDVDRPGSRGTHALLRSGARPCEGVGDVLDALAEMEAVPPPALRSGAVTSAPRPAARARSSGHAGATANVAVVDGAATTDAMRLVGALDERGVDTETLALRLGWDLSRTLAELLPLEWSRVVERRPGGRWARRASSRK